MHDGSRVYFGWGCGGEDGGGGAEHICCGGQGGDVVSSPNTVTVVLCNAHLSDAIAAHTVHAGAGKGVRTM